MNLLFKSTDSHLKGEHFVYAKAIKASELIQDSLFKLPPSKVSSPEQPGLSVHQLLDYHQAATPFFCLLILLIFRPHNLCVYIFASLFSGNSLITLVKEYFVPEFRFHQTATKGGTIGSIELLSTLNLLAGLLARVSHQRAQSR